MSAGSLIPAPSLCFMVATALFALVAVTAQLLGGSLMRGGAPSPFDPPVPKSGYSEEHSVWNLLMFEKQLVSDFGSTLNNFGALFTVTTVAASVSIGFPSWWLIGMVATIIFSFFPFVAVSYGLRQMIGKRNRMQNLFDALPPTDPDAQPWATGSGGFQIRSSRDYWMDRHPSFRLWRSSPTWKRVRLLLKQIRWSAGVHFPMERT